MPDANDLERWLAEFELEPGDRTERDGISAWDVTVDGRRRLDLRVTVILDPSIGAILWAHLAPPIGDGLRKAYRTLLRWNDEFPLAKFSIAEDGRPILAVEIPDRWLDANEVGLAITDDGPEFLATSPTESSMTRGAGSGSAAASRTATPTARAGPRDCSRATASASASSSRHEGPIRGRGAPPRDRALAPRRNARRPGGDAGLDARYGGDV